MVNKGNHPQMALIQVSEMLYFTQMNGGLLTRNSGGYQCKKNLSQSQFGHEDRGHEPAKMGLQPEMSTCPVGMLPRNQKIIPTDLYLGTD